MNAKPSQPATVTLPLADDWAVPRVDFGWGIVGPGPIAHKFADAVARLPGTSIVAVQGRDAGRTQAFADRWQVNFDDAVTTDLDAMLTNPRVDGVYIATPHAFHADSIRRCLQAEKPVLCEKAMVVNAVLAEEVTALARQRGVFLMEALWTRFLPIYETVQHWLQTGAIGAIRGVQSSFAFNVPFNPESRLFDPAQAGGCLLDIGIYNLAMTQWALRTALGACPPLTALDARAVLGPTGVDHRLAATLHFSGGIAAQMQCSFEGRADNALRIFGEDGVISLPRDFWKASTAVLQRWQQAEEVIDLPGPTNGFEGEIAEAIRCIRQGAIESPIVPHADSVELAVWMDRIRREIGVHYPFE